MTGNLRMDTVRPFRWTSFENMKRAQEVTAISTRAIQETRELATHDSVLTSVAGNLAYRCSGWFEITIPDMAVELPVVYWQSIRLLIGRSLVQAQPQEPDKNPELRFRVFVTRPPRNSFIKESSIRDTAADGLQGVLHRAHPHGRRQLARHRVLSRLAGRPTARQGFQRIRHGRRETRRQVVHRCQSIPPGSRTRNRRFHLRP